MRYFVCHIPKGACRCTTLDIDNETARFQEAKNIALTNAFFMLIMRPSDLAR